MKKIIQTALVLLLIFLGTPYLDMPQQVLVNLVAFAYVYWTLASNLQINLSGKIFITFLLWLLLSSGPFPVRTTDFNILITLATGILIALAMEKLVKKSNRRELTILPMLVCLVVASQMNSGQLRQYLKTDPPNGTYGSDWGLFLKTYYNMEKQGYYQGQVEALEYHPSLGPKPPADLWSWRFPTVFWIWSLLSPGQNGVFIYYQYLVLSCFVLISGYYLADHFLIEPNKPYALLATLYLYNYFRLPLYIPQILQTEWWAVPFMMFGLALFIKNKKAWGITFLTLAVVIREMYFIPLVLFIAISFLLKRENLKYFLICLTIFFLVVIFHAYSINQIVPLFEKQQHFSPRLNGSLDLFLITLDYGRGGFLLKEWSINRILFGLFILAGVGAPSILLRKDRQKTKSMKVLYKLLLVIAPASLGIFYLVIGTGKYSENWGALYLPIALSLVPLLINLQPSKEK